MGLIKFIRDVLTLTRYDALKRALAQNKATGFNDIEAGAGLLLHALNLPMTNDALVRAVRLSSALGDLVIGFIMFSKRIGTHKAIKNALLTDRFPELHQCLYFTSVPLSDFARKCMNRIWNHQRVSPADATEAAFAAFSATLVTPFAVDAWLMLAELKGLGFCPEIDTRDHLREGIRNAREFLETATNVDPEFRALLNEGIMHLSKMGKA